MAPDGEINLRPRENSKAVMIARVGNLSRLSGHTSPARIGRAVYVFFFPVLCA